MLSEKTISQVKARIDSINKKLAAEANQTLSDGKGTKDVLDQLVKHATREFSSESQMLMDSVYNVLSNETLKTEFFRVTAHETSFNKRNIQADLANRFSFEVPDEIDYKKSYTEMLASGGIVVVGGAISIGMKSLIPISIAAVIAILMYRLIVKHKKKDQRQLIKDYLDSIKDTLVRWLENIAEYYEQQVETLKAELERQGV